jgi:hypothetical protein
VPPIAPLESVTTPLEESEPSAVDKSITIETGMQKKYIIMTPDCC